MSKRRKFTAEFKRKIVGELDVRHIEEVCNEYELHNQLVLRWKRELSANPENAFKGNGNICKEDARIAQLERKIGQLTMENDLLKKSISLSKRLRQEEMYKKRCIR